MTRPAPVPPPTGLDRSRAERSLERGEIGQLYVRDLTHEGRHRLLLHGSLDRFTSPILLRHTTPLLEADMEVEIDLANASLDPSGVRVLADLLAMDKHGTSLKISGLAGSARSALNEAGMAGRLEGAA